MIIFYRLIGFIFNRDVFAMLLIVSIILVSTFFLHLSLIYLLYLSIGLIILVLLINYPQIALFTDLIFVFVLVGLSSDLYSTWSYKGFTFLSIVTLIINRIYKRKEIVFGSYVDFGLFIGYIIFAIISSIVNQIGGIYNYMINLLTKYSIAFLIANLVDSRKILYAYFTGFVVIGTFNNIVGITQVILDLDWYGFGPRAIGFLVNPNGMGYLQVQLIPMIFILMSQTKNRKYRTILMILFIMCPITAILSQSRGTALATLAVMAGIFLVSIRNYYAIAMIVIASVVIALFWQEPYTERFRSTFERKDILEESRGYLYRAAVLMIIDHPIFGVGQGQFGYQLISTYGSRINAPFKRYYVNHNGYFEIMTTAGIPGSLFLLAMIGLWIRRFYKSARFAKSIGDYGLYQLCSLMIVSIIGYTIVAAFETLIEAKQFYYYVGLNFAIINIISKEKSERENQQKTVNLSIKTPQTLVSENT